MVVSGAAAAVVSLVIGVPQALAATNAGPAEVVVPITNTRLTSGGSSTEFTLKLPLDASCTKDSANDNYRVQSYMVLSTVDPATLTFSSVGPAGGKPLFDNGGTPYVNAQTANAVTPGGPGQVINIPTFNYAVFSPGQIAPGTYNIGIACTSAPTVVDKFWNVQKTFTADPADAPAQVRWAVAAAATATTTTLAVGPAGGAAAGVDVTLTATVSPAAAGTVTFKDGATALGSPVAVSNGTATLTTKTLATGTRTLTAAFAPASGTPFVGSTSSAVTFAISAGGNQTSTTSTSTSSTTSSTSTTGADRTVTGTGTGTGTTTGPRGTLPKTGASLLVPLAWAFSLICLGRAAMLLPRRPTERARSGR